MFDFKHTRSSARLGIAAITGCAGRRSTRCQTRPRSFQIKDRLSFQRFLGVDLDGTVPDATTVWLFRERLMKAKAIDKLFARSDAALTIVIEFGGR